MDLKDIKSWSQKGEMEYAPVPPSGRGNKETPIKLSDVLNTLKPFSIRKPIVFIAGSLATQGESHNDIDLIIRGEDISSELRTAIDFRLYRMFADFFKVPYDEITKFVSIHYTNSGPFTDYIPIYELTLMPIENTEIVRMSDVSQSLRTLSEEKRIIAGYGSVPVFDRSNEFITLDALKKALKSFLEQEYCYLYFNHKSIIIGKILKEYGEFKTQVDSNGLFVVAELRQDNDIANKIWKDIKEGKLHYFSIGYLANPKDTKVECDDKTCSTIIEEISLMEVSVVGEGYEPLNPLSSFATVVENAVEKSGKMEKEEIQQKIQEEVKSEEQAVQQEQKAENIQTQEQQEVKSNEEEIDEEKAKKTATQLLEEILKEDIPKEVKDKIQKVLDMLKKYPYPYPTKYPYPTEYPYPSKKDLEDLTQKVLNEITLLKSLFQKAEEAEKEPITVATIQHNIEIPQVAKKEFYITRTNPDGSVTTDIIP